MKISVMMPAWRSETTASPEPNLITPMPVTSDALAYWENIHAIRAIKSVLRKNFIAEPPNFIPVTNQADKHELIRNIPTLRVMRDDCRVKNNIIRTLSHPASASQALATL